MAQMIDQIFWWLDGNRLSQWARVEDFTDGIEGVDFVADEDRRMKQYPGKASGSFRIVLRDYDAPTMDILGGYDGASELAFMRTLNVAAGQKAWLYRANPMSNIQGGAVLATRAAAFSLSGNCRQSLGKNLFAYSTDITAPANGSTITLGALSATQSLLIMSHVEAVSGTGNLDHKVVHDPAGTPADAKVFTQVAHTDIANPANHNSGQYALFNGPKTPTDYRVEITAVSGGTWNIQVAAAIIEEL